MLTAASILQTVATALQGLQWQGAPAFADVRLYDTSDLPRACTELLLSGERLAMVIYGGGAWSDVGLDATSTTVSRVLTFSVLVTDTVTGDGPAGVYGGDDNPGVLWLQEQVVAALLVQIGDDVEHTRLLPTKDSLVTISPEDNSQPGRKAGVVEFVSEGEFLKVANEVIE